MISHLVTFMLFSAECFPLWSPLSLCVTAGQQILVPVCHGSEPPTTWMQSSSIQLRMPVTHLSPLHE